MKLNFNLGGVFCMNSFKDYYDIDEEHHNDSLSFLISDICWDFIYTYRPPSISMQITIETSILNKTIRRIL